MAFDEARKRKATLTSIHKSNVLATSRFWKTIVEEVASDYPDVPYQSVLVDNAAFQLVVNPVQFNGVMLLENMQGDILTDQAGGIIGSLGLMPSACIGPEKAYVEPAHGSAPDIAGQGIANPIAQILSAAMLLRFSFALDEAADAIENAVKKTLAAGIHTRDIAIDPNQTVDTAAMGDAILENL